MAHMADLQEKLEQYRVKKRRKETFDYIKDRFKRFVMLGTGRSDSTHKADTEIEIKTEFEKDEHFEEEAESEVLDTSDDNEIQPEKTISDPSKESNFLKYTLWTVYFLFWVTLYIIAIELQFGLVFLLFSALLGIYFNTRTGPRKRNEISAYSVFNKNCESIDGTLKAEQFEREMRYGAGSVR